MPFSPGNPSEYLKKYGAVNKQYDSDEDGLADVIKLLEYSGTAADRQLFRTPKGLAVYNQTLNTLMQTAAAPALFDNDNGGGWTSFIEIPLSTSPSTDENILLQLSYDPTTPTSWIGLLNPGTSTGPTYSDIPNLPDLVTAIVNNPNDLRVADQNLNQLYFWIERVYSASPYTIYCFIKVPANTTSLILAYGNTVATKSTYNDPTQTFAFFDDFEDTTLFATAPSAYSSTVVQHGSYSAEYDDTSTIAGGGWNVLTSIDLSTQGVKEWFYPNFTSATYTALYGFYGYDGTDDYAVEVGYDAGAGSLVSRAKDLTSATTVASLGIGSTLIPAPNAASWHHFAILDSTTVALDGTTFTPTAGTATYTLPFTEVGPHVDSGDGQTGSCYFDEFIIWYRNLTAVLDWSNVKADTFI